MLFRSGIVFLICAIFMHVVNVKASANVICLLYDDEDLPLPKWEFVTVRYCYKKKEHCCGTECCTDNKGLVVMGVVGMIIAVCVYVCYHKVCSQDNTTSFRMNTNLPEPRRDLPDLETDTILLTNRHEAAVQESNNHPITPPPSYNVAILAPSVPALLPENRVPSYEDVMAGK